VWNVVLSHCLFIQPLSLRAATVRRDAWQRPSCGVGSETKKREINNYKKMDKKRERRGKIERRDKIERRKGIGNEEGERK